MTSQQTGGLKPTRRTLVKGAAWSVPVVAMAGAAPAFAASPTFSVTGVTVGCKFSSSAAYHLEITIENTGNQANTIEDVVVTGQGSNGNTLVWPAVADKCMCPGDKWVLVINSVPDAASSSFGAQIQWAGVTPQALNIPDNTPDCNSVKPPYQSYNTPNTVTWIPLDVSSCVECPGS